MKRTVLLTTPTARRTALAYVQDAPDGHAVTISEPSRNLKQNAAQWPILEAFSEQLEWPVNGRMVRMSAEEWKDVLSAAFKNETARLAMGLDGGVVMLGMRTSLMSKKQFSEWLDFLHSVAADRGVDVGYPIEPAGILARKALELCATPAFVAWLWSQHAEEDTEPDEDWAEEVIKFRCKVQSLANIDGDAAARHRFDEQIRGPWLAFNGGK